MKHMRQGILFFIIISVSAAGAVAGDFVNYSWIEVNDFSGTWKFEIGDDMRWAQAGFDDSRWESIYVPSSWEDEGFPGYDGFAWYRYRFTIESRFRGEQLALFLGYIDDVDEVYLNGTLIGYRGGMPPDVQTAYHMERRYAVPSDYLNFDGINVIAVRVYDNFQVGGIVRGKIGMFRVSNPIRLDLDLSGAWKFHTGDQIDWKEPLYNDSHWEELIVPALWEGQGYRHYDGFAWYRKTFRLPNSCKDNKLILLLGKIDDLDETYINGERIGRTGIIYTNTDRIQLGDHYQELRAYFIPPDKLNYDTENTVAVRVYDGFIHGGIYEGPIGIVRREVYVSWWNDVKDVRGKSFFEMLFGK